MRAKSKVSLQLCLLLCAAGSGNGQELVPRRWTHLPADMNIIGTGVAFSEGDVVFDPVLQIESATVELSTYAGRFIRTFSCWGKSARAEVFGSYQVGTWEGLLQGERASTSRSGWADPRIRLAVNLAGAPALRGDDFAEFRRTHRHQTILGAGLWVGLPLGEYLPDKLINLGDNRYTIVPQLGVLHTHGNWTGELTGSVWCFTDNNDFLQDRKLTRSPSFAGQAHLSYTLRPGLWIGGGTGYGYDGETSVDGQKSDNKRNALLYAVSFGFPLGRRSTAKIQWLALRSQNDLYGDVDTLAASFTFLW